jgi:hypothetical protein
VLSSLLERSMTEQDQDAVVGKTVRELRDVREKLEKLRASCRDYRDAFSTVEHHLQAKLEFLRVANESTDARFVNDADERFAYGREPHIPRKEFLDIGAVLKIRDEIRMCLLEEARLNDSLSRMGFAGN